MGNCFYRKQWGREERNDLFDMGNPFSIFGGFDDPFDDPSFTRPSGSMFDQSSWSRDIAPTKNSNGIVIEELDSDREGDQEDEGSVDSKIHSGSSKEPLVQHPDDDDDDVEDGKNDDVNYKTQHTKAQGTQPQPQPQARSFSFRTCRVTYGGVDGAYYASSRTRRTGNGSVVLEESKEADRTTGKASHRISRGINDKGHSLTRKLNSDGKVDTLQTLHNLNEDELPGFEEAWKVNASKHLPNWSEGFDMNRGAGSSRDEQMGRPAWGDWALPSLEQTRNTGVATSDNETSANASGGRTRKVVRINID